MSALLAVGGCRRESDPLPGFPSLVLWAWERPENLLYVDTASTGVAYLAGTIRLNSGRVMPEPRAQPLLVPAKTSLIAVVRLEVQTPELPATAEVAQRIAELVRGVAIRAVQIDFDARLSQRFYYRELMQALRPILPAPILLEMTARVSWCQSDMWLRGMPVVEAVPMFFRISADPRSTGEPLIDPLCQNSVGMATDELQGHVPRGKRMFVFNSRPWNETSYRAVLQARRAWF